jgi:hypothetical protein
MGYADLSAAAFDVGLELNNPAHAAQVQRLAELDDDVALMIDQETGRSFGGVAAPTVRAVPLPPRTYCDILSLPFAVRSVTSIAFVGDQEETLSPGDWALIYPTEQSGDYHAIQRIDGGWFPSAYGSRTACNVTAIWSDTPDGQPVPALVVRAATFILKEEYVLRAANANAEVGVSDGLVVNPRNPWKYKIVQDMVKKYGTAKSRASF